MPKPYRFKPLRARRYRPLLRIVLLLAIVAVLGLTAPGWIGAGESFDCPGANVIDGDTLRCGDRIVRLEGIDAPEREGACQPGRECAPGDPDASTAHLITLVEGADLQCRVTDTDQHGRTVARCSAGEIDLSCAQIKSRQAIRRYATIFCWP